MLTVDGLSRSHSSVRGAASVGPDTRGEVLLAEATRKPKVTAGCRLVGGRWVSRYDGTVHTSATGLHIDHLVALSEAWKSGAYRWTNGTRRRYVTTWATRSR